MIIVLRLQGLDVKAGAEDIRRFFNNIHIPDGGVYIVGGRQKEAFIAFTTEQDAQLAMQHNGAFLKRSKVTLCLSSMKELEQKLKSTLKGKKASYNKLMAKKRPSPKASLSTVRGERLDLKPANIRSSTVTSPPSAATSPPSTTTSRPSAATSPPSTATSRPSAATSPPSTATFPPSTTTSKPSAAASPPSAATSPPSTTTTLESIDAQSLNSNAAFLLGVCTVLKSLQQSYHEGENIEMVPRIDFPQADGKGVVSGEERIQISRPGYVRVFGLPASTTKDDICQFFRGLTVQEVIVNVLLGLKHGCLVKFANAQDACDALCFNQHSMGSICVEVRGATEMMWTNALQECENGFHVEEDEATLKQSPLRETLNHRPLASALQIKRKRVNGSPTPCKKQRTACDSTPGSVTTEHIVMVRKVPKTMTKTEIKELFGCPNLAHKKVLHLLNNEGNRTDTAFIMFDQTEDYEYAMHLNGCHVGSEAIEVSSITREKMRDIMAVYRPRKKKLISNSAGNPGEMPITNLDPAARTCLFVRNLPADVQIGHIKGLFRKYKPNHHGITILQDSDGRGMGEAVVQFKSQKLAMMAQQLNSRDFLGAKVLLTLINVEQMKDILAKNV